MKSIIRAYNILLNDLSKIDKRLRCLWMGPLTQWITVIQSIFLKWTCSCLIFHTHNVKWIQFKRIRNIDVESTNGKGKKRDERLIWQTKRTISFRFLKWTEKMGFVPMIHEYYSHEEWETGPFRRPSFIALYFLWLSMLCYHESFSFRCIKVFIFP